MKLPFDFGMKLVFRLLVPGLFLTLALLPVMNAVLSLGGWGASFEYVFVLTVIFVGWLVVISDMPLYMLFEGRRFWPEWLWTLFVRREARRILNLQARIEQYKAEKDDATLPAVRRERASRKYLETYVELRSYPVAGSGEQRPGGRVDYVSRFPTRLGNILEAYEDIPYRLYGIPSVFYWWRVWLTLGKDEREEIDGQQALVDSAVYTSFAFFFNAAVWAFYAVLLGANTLALRLFEPLTLGPSLFTHLPPWWALPVLSAVSLLIGFIIYRTSLYLHVQFGEVYKSVYDVRRGELKPEEIVADTLLATQPYFRALTVKQKHDAVYNYLVYNLIKCPRCGRYASAEKLDDPCAGHAAV